jgi:hypothetical protein
LLNYRKDIPMKIRATAVLIFSLMVVLSCGDNSDPVGPTQNNDSEYYPLAIGNQWIYSRSGSIAAAGLQVGTVSGVAEIEITGTATHSEGFEVYVQENSITDTTVLYSQTYITDSTFTEYLRVTDSGLFGYPHLTDTDSSYTVPFPIQQGATWVFSDAPLTTGEILSLTESVTVPAGNFNDCMEMRLIWSDSGSTVTNTADFARNVGDIRNVFQLVYGALTTTVTNSLETYTVN